MAGTDRDGHGDDRHDRAKRGMDAMLSEPLTVLVLGDAADARLVREALQDRDQDPEPGDDSAGTCADSVELRRAATLQDGIDEWDEDIGVVIAELELPDSAGLETVEALANANANGSRDRNRDRSAPIVVLGSGLESSVDAVEAIKHGAQEYVEKDQSDPNTLGRRLRCAIERSGTERALRRRNRTLADLISVAGHDIRNDIAVVEGWRGVIEEHVDSTGRNGLDRIENASQNVLRIVETANDLLEPLDSRRETEIRPIDVVGVARTEVETARAAFPAAEIEFVENIPEDEAVEATEQLSAVFRELLTNGIRYNDNSTPSATIELTDGARAVTAEVVDNGSGVSANHRDEVFGRGERGLESPEARLGLYLVDTLVSEYGGTVDIADTDSGGTSIEVTLRKVTPAPKS